MTQIRISQDNYDKFKSIMNGRSWDQILADAYRLLTQQCTNNNTSTDVPSTAPEPKPYVEYGSAIILPTGTVLVDSDRYILDITGARIRFTDFKAAIKTVRYLRTYTSHQFNSHDEQEYRAAHFVRRWYTADDYQNKREQQELLETSQFLASVNHALSTNPISSATNLV